jgi:hypothetical protein
VAITEGNRTSRVAAEPSAAGHVSESGLLHHRRAGSVRIVREATPLSAYTSFAPQSRLDLPDVAATGAHAAYV